jgi:hypothetical protein
MSQKHVQMLSLAVLLAMAASPALAQFSGGVTQTGETDPRVLARALVTLFIGVALIICVGAWAKVAAALMGRGQVTDGYIWGCGAGTVILGSCGFIAWYVLGGGGGGGGGVVPA